MSHKIHRMQPFYSKTERDVFEIQNRTIDKIPWKLVTLSSQYVIREGFSVRVAAGRARVWPADRLSTHTAELGLFTKNYTAIDFYPDRAN